MPCGFPDKLVISLEVFSWDTSLTSTCGDDDLLQGVMGDTTWEQRELSYNRSVCAEKVDIASLTTSHRAGLHQQQVSLACQLKHNHLTWINTSTNGIYLEVLGTSSPCNMLQHVLLFELLTGHTHFFSVTHTAEEHRGNVASFYLVYFLKYWLVSEVLRKQNIKKNYTVFLLQMENISTPSWSYIHMTMSETPLNNFRKNK